MFSDMTRSRLIRIWFTAVALVVVAGFALGATMTLSTAAILLALSLVPPAIIVKLWPSIQPQTISEVLHGRERR
jgi:hypothetical protein